MSSSYPSNRTFGTKDPHTMYRFQVPSCEQVYNHFKQARQEFESTFSGISFSAMNSQQKKETENYLYRSQIIMAYSAFDLFMHEILYLGFFKMRKGFINQSAEYEKFTAGDGYLSEQEFNENLKDEYGFETLTTHYNWKNALEWLDFDPETVSQIYLAEQKEYYTGSAYAFLKITLKNKSHRRNKLVHSYDFNIPGGSQSPITKEIAEDFINFISGIVNTVYECVKQKWD